MYHKILIPFIFEYLHAFVLIFEYLTILLGEIQCKLQLKIQTELNSRFIAPIFSRQVYNVVFI